MIDMQCITPGEAALLGMCWFVISVLVGTIYWIMSMRP